MALMCSYDRCRDELGPLPWSHLTLITPQRLCFPWGHIHGHQGLGLHIFWATWFNRLTEGSLRHSWKSCVAHWGTTSQFQVVCGRLLHPPSPGAFLQAAQPTSADSIQQASPWPAASPSPQLHSGWAGGEARELMRRTCISDTSCRRGKFNFCVWNSSRVTSLFPGIFAHFLLPYSLAFMPSWFFSFLSDLWQIYWKRSHSILGWPLVDKEFYLKILSILPVGKYLGKSYHWTNKCTF